MRDVLIRSSDVEYLLLGLLRVLALILGAYVLCIIICEVVHEWLGRLALRGRFGIGQRRVDSHTVAAILGVEFASRCRSTLL